MCGRLDSYLLSYATLPMPRDKSRWSTASSFRSPEAPFLLLALSNQIAAGKQHRPFIAPTSDFIESFHHIFSYYPNSDKTPDISAAFLLLAKTSFWQLRPQTKISRIQRKSIHMVEQLRTYYYGAEIAHDLYNLLQMAHSRKRLNQQILHTHFSTEMQHILNKILL